MSCEDVMFVSDDKIVSLEYIFYKNTNEVKYTKLKQCDGNMLNTQNFGGDQCDADGHSINVHYKEKPLCFDASEGLDYLKSNQ